MAAEIEYLIGKLNEGGYGEAAQKLQDTLRGLQTSGLIPEEITGTLEHPIKRAQRLGSYLRNYFAHLPDDFKLKERHEDENWSLLMKQFEPGEKTTITRALNRVARRGYSKVGVLRNVTVAELRSGFITSNGFVEMPMAETHALLISTAFGVGDE